MYAGKCESAEASASPKRQLRQDPGARSLRIDKNSRCYRRHHCMIDTINPFRIAASAADWIVVATLRAAEGQGSAGIHPGEAGQWACGLRAVWCEAVAGDFCHPGTDCAGGVKSPAKKEASLNKIPLSGAAFCAPINRLYQNSNPRDTIAAILHSFSLHCTGCRFGRVP